MDIAERVARLEAESDIRRLKARYLNACDRKDSQMLRDCFTVDATIEFPPLGKFNLDGLVSIFSQIAVSTPIIDTHQGHNAEIVINDDNTAIGRWHLSFTTYDPRKGSFRLLSSFYEDHYVRTAEGWKISATRSEPRMIIDGKLTTGAVIAEFTPIADS